MDNGSRKRVRGQTAVRAPKGSPRVQLRELTAKSRKDSCSKRSFLRHVAGGRYEYTELSDHAASVVELWATTTALHVMWVSCAGCRGECEQALSDR